MAADLLAVVEEVVHDKDRPITHDERPTKRQRRASSETTSPPVIQVPLEDSDDDDDADDDSVRSNVLPYTHF